MIKRIKQWRKNKYNALLQDVVMIVAVLLAISWWQNRGTMAATGQLAPGFELTDLNGNTHNIREYHGKQVLVYFFAPWCSVCRFSADNLNDLRAARSEDDLIILMMALSYGDRTEVEEFVADLELQVPVLLGSDQQMTDYQIQGFPTYYVIDDTNHLESKSIGYSTELGMRFRTR